MTRILLVDDDRDVIVSMRTVLEWQGYTVDIYDRPETALRYFSARKYDIAIIDTKMPRMSGLELARMIYDMDKNTKIILMSAADLDKAEFEKTVMYAKIDAYMKKPRGITKLISHIEALLKQKKQELVAVFAAATAPLMALTSDVISVVH